MSSNRLALLFLGFILIIVLVLSSKRIAGFLRSRFSRFLPSSITTEEQITPTPTPISSLVDITKKGKLQKSTPTPIRSPQIALKKGAPPTGEIPATGPAEVVWMLLGSGAAGGIIIRKLSSRPKN
jgi:hypothetical protein